MKSCIFKQKTVSGEQGQNSRKLQNQSTMVVQGHLTWEEAEVVTSETPKGKNTVKKKKYGLMILGKQQLTDEGLPWCQVLN